MHSDIGILSIDDVIWPCSCSCSFWLLHLLSFCSKHNSLYSLNFYCHVPKSYSKWHTHLLAIERFLAKCSPPVAKSIWGDRWYGLWFIDVLVLLHACVPLAVIACFSPAVCCRSCPLLRLLPLVWPVSAPAAVSYVCLLCHSGVGLLGGLLWFSSPSFCWPWG